MLHLYQDLDNIDKIRDHVALGLISTPGVGKTETIFKWAADHNRNVTVINTSQTSPFEVSGMAIPKEDSMSIVDFNTLKQLKEGDVLFFDEFTNGNIQTMNACLTLIQDRRMVSGFKLPSILVVAAGNNDGVAAMTPQIKQRFWWRNVEIHVPTLSCYFIEKYGTTIPTSNLHKVNQEMFAKNVLNYDTPRSMENYIRMFLNLSLNVLPEEVENLYIYNPLPKDQHKLIAKLLNALKGTHKITEQLVEMFAIAIEDNDFPFDKFLKRVVYALKHTPAFETLKLTDKEARLLESHLNQERSKGNANTK